MISARKASALIAAMLIAMPASARAQDTAPDIAAELQAMRKQIAELEAKVQRLEAERAAGQVPPPVAAAVPPAPATAPATDIVWRGSPQLRQADQGFSFKVRGFVQYDAGFVDNPRNAIPTDNLGFNSRGRRIVFGAEGALPGGFGYKAEFNFGGGNLDYEDVIITYAAPGSPIQLTLGNFFPLAGLEATTSSRLGSVLEREQATDAFGLQRRIGIAARYTDPKDRFLVEAGIFNGQIGSGFENDSWQASARTVYSPRLGERARLHLGANFQHRETQSDVQNLRYRSRPLTQITDIRLIDTQPIAAKGDDILGIELVGIFGPFHFAAEGHRSWVDGYRPGIVGGVSSGLPYAADPSFQTGYAEIGYYLTGEMRAYRSGRWDNLRVLSPLGKGGWGALQVNARIDHADLSDQVGPTFGYPDFVDGGTQTAYQLSAIWNPTDYIRLLLQYSRIEIEGGPFALNVVPDSSLPVHERRYGTDSVAVRTQVEF